MRKIYSYFNYKIRNTIILGGYMTKEEIIQDLKRWIQVDRSMRNESDINDYNEFCEKHCKEIEYLIKEVSDDE